MRTKRLPAAMVLVFEPALTHSVWQDYESRRRSIKGLLKELQQGVKDGQWVGFRLMTIQAEIVGNVGDG